MILQFYFIDFENVQPKGIGLLKPGTCQIKLFLGQSQSKVSLDLSQALQPFGPDVEYVQIAGNGPNAVDFHIAFYIGRLAQVHAGAKFIIVSRDTGFDPLVKHLASLKIACKRIPALAATPAPDLIAVVPPKASLVKKSPAAKAASSKTPVVTILPGLNGPPDKPKPVPAELMARASEVLSRLHGMKSARPARVATLKSSLKAWFVPAMSDETLASLIDALVHSQKIKIDGSKVTYALG